MDNYVFNLDLDTWGLTDRNTELARFAPFMSPEEISKSNALFGYHGDSYYYDIDIRKHFGLDKYDGDIIPYWKTETLEAMDSFRYRKGYFTGAGECVSLAGLYAAASFVVCGFPLKSIYLMATPLHSQNYIDVDTGILTNNRRLVTKAMWANGTVISQQARRALENERVTIVSHSSGYIHLLYKDATISPDVYADFSSKLKTFLIPPKDSPDQRVVNPKLPDSSRVDFTSENSPLDITPEMDYSEVAQRLEALSSTNAAAFLSQYAARDLGKVESAPFMKAALERCPVSKNALRGLEEKEILSIVYAMGNESIYDGSSRLAQPDEVWNFSRGDGLEKCVMLANVLGGDEIRIENGEASLVKNGKTVFSSPSIKCPKDKIFIV
jgi:hypothetical protein